MDTGRIPLLKGLLGSYPNTAEFLAGRLKSPAFDVEFADIRPVHSGFKGLIRDRRFDFGELAIVSYLQAREAGAPYVLLPITIYARSQHANLVRMAANPFAPQELTGRRVGVRSYAQTSGVWTRGILDEEYGVAADRVRWITFEESHVADVTDPPWCERAPEGADMRAMLETGEIDAAIFGGDRPNDPAFTSVILDPEAAGRHFAAAHGFVPINHMVVVSEAMCTTAPDLVGDLFHILATGNRNVTAEPAIDLMPIPIGIEANRHALEMAIALAHEQAVIARPVAVDELFNDVTRMLGS